MAGVLFLHIPKAAGTSLRNALIKTFGPCPAPFGISRVSAAEAAAWAPYPLISGHMSRADQVRWFPDRRLFVVLREPIDRCISAIYYLRSIPAHIGENVVAAQTLPVIEFVDHPLGRRSLTNNMVRQLGGHVSDEVDASTLPSLLDRAKETLLQAEWVGFKETLARDFARVSSAPIERENVTPNRPAWDDIPLEVIARLRELNVYDAQLWEWAKETFNH